MARPGISVIIPCLNEARHIRACLGCILAQEPVPDGREFEVLIADGRSEDGTREIIAVHAADDPRLRLIDNPGRIVSTGLNAAIRQARGSIILRMDAHTEYAPDYLRQCVAVLEATGADNVGGPALTRTDGSYWARAIAAAYHSPFSVGGARFHAPDYEGPLDTVVYGCWRKETLLRIGLFDEDLVRNQDDELNFRLARAGGRLWQSPRIRSWYRPRGSLRDLFRQYRQYGYWKVQVMRKHGRPASPRHLVPLAFVLGLTLGWIPGLIHPGLLRVYMAASVAYGALAAIFAIRAGVVSGRDLVPALPVVFLTYHVAYGLGLLCGFLDALLLRRPAGPGMTGLTRSPAAVDSGEAGR